MASSHDVHVAKTSCLLCRQSPTAGTYILDLARTRLVVPEYRYPCASCNRSPSPSVWFHPACYEILEATYEPSGKPTMEELGKLAAATRPRYESRHAKGGEVASVLEGLLSKYTTRILQESFDQDLLRRLPLEIRVMIAELIGPCWYLTVLGESRRLIEHLRQPTDSQCMQLDLTRDIWISRINYRGSFYVARISNTPLKSTVPSGQSHIQPPSTISKVVLSIDGIGLRGLQVLDPYSSPTSDRSPWFEILEAGKSQLKAQVTFDGLFVRGIRLSGNDVSSAMNWTSPCPPKFNPWNFYDVHKNHRLHYVELHAQVQGLLVCCANGSTVGIHGFSGTSKPFRDFVDFMHGRRATSYKHWIYFPLNGQEAITGAWIRKIKVCRGSASHPVLVVSPTFLVRFRSLTGQLQTSLGRAVTFGPHYPARIIDQYEYHPLLQHGDGPISGIFHDGLDPVSKYISEFGVTCSDLGQADIREPPPVGSRFEPPPIPPGRGSIITTWYMTKAPLNGLVRVQACRDQAQPHRPYLGLLLFYNDQHVESLGQVRWDLDMNQEILSPMYVRKGIVDGRNYVKDIQSDSPPSGPDLESGEWQRLPGQGTLVWWSGHVEP
ncbi:uncharacterized protein BO80DRAFT_491448 [Aspergillus ibericus CBS 121593]|uniref:Uncharacterized protein n=1 Tax=Aspergillus ibericus CBS 121593 TaxID=1448316 RepID=A0A395H9T3_9EURO|nr:hypothetical protein BO80DRAFT_491448 [Aspergillus ibericus CBS 121593]RAL04253.1 hypothetical protein BO80DRAFT_491448 [Aspergillus ibericus CBS 121593]